MWDAQSEWGHLEKVLMFRPGREVVDMVARYGAEAMDYGAPVSLACFQDEFDQMTSAFEAEGAEVILINDLLADDDEIMRYVSRRPNMVFTRDLAAVVRGGAILSRMSRKSRRGDSHVMKRALEKLGVPILAEISAPGTVEGGDYVFIDDETLAEGWSGRTNEAGLEQLREILMGSHIKELVVPSLRYGSGHLDGRFMMVDPNLAAGHMDDLTVYPATVYRDGEPPRYVFMDDYLDARGIEFIEGRANFTIGPRIVLNCKAYRESTVALRAKGVRVIEIDGEMMKRAESGPHCLTCPLSRS